MIMCYSTDESLHFILHCGSKNVTPFTTAIIPLILNGLFSVFRRNTARGICNLLLCIFTYYLIMQLGTSLCCHG